MSKLDSLRSLANRNAPCSLRFLKEGQVVEKPGFLTKGLSSFEFLLVGRTFTANDVSFIDHGSKTLIVLVEALPIKS